MTIEIVSSLKSSGRGARLQANRIGFPRHQLGHSHFWQKALSRRTFLQVSAAAAGGVLIGSQGWMPARASVPGPTPKAIPGGFSGLCGLPPTEIFHNFAPNVFDPPNTDRSGIFDFNGLIGYAVIDGTGTGRNTVTGATTPLTFEVDLRFMQGVYIGEDGKNRHATFCLI